MSAPAPVRRRVSASARFEATTVLRNGEQLLVSIVLPLMALLLLTYASYPVLEGSTTGADGRAGRIDIVTPGVLALAVVSTAFTGQAISTAFDRRYGVLRLLGVSPLGRGGLMAGKALAVLAVLAVQSAVVGSVALALGWRPSPVGVAPLAITLVLGSGCFVTLAVLLAGALRAEAVLAVANLLWVLFLGCGLLLPTSVLPDGVAEIAAWLPPGLLGDAARSSALDGTWPLAAWAVLLGWTVVAGVLARRTFRWSD